MKQRRPRFWNNRTKHYPAESGQRVYFDGAGYDGWQLRPKPSTPTNETPGTVGKLLVMADRAERGEQLHHPQDSFITDDHIQRFIERIG